MPACRQVLYVHTIRVYDCTHEKVLFTHVHEQEDKSKSKQTSKQMSVPGGEGITRGRRISRVRGVCRKTVSESMQLNEWTAGASHKQ